MTTETMTLERRAIEAHNAAVKAAEEFAKQQAVERVEASKQLLIKLLEKHLQLEVDPGALVVRDTDVAMATIDGLTFSAWAGREYDFYEEKLFVERTCSRCGQPVAVEIAERWDDDAFARLGNVLAMDEHVHRFDCRERDAESEADYVIVTSPQDRLHAAALKLGEARAHEQLLEDGRAVEWQAAILRLMQVENPLTNKPHSASSAEKVIELDEQYAAYRARQREAVVAVQVAHAEYEAAKAALHREER